MIWTVLEWVSTAMSFTGTSLVANHNHLGWLWCTLADVGFVVFAVNKKLWGFFSLCLGYAAINIYGWLQ
jgi:nicotinamide mononucleotide transporter